MGMVLGEKKKKGDISVFNEKSIYKCSLVHVFGSLCILYIMIVTDSVTICYKQQVK